MLKQIEHCNVEALLDVKKRILAEPEGFNMAVWCGTACCIAGHALQLHKLECIPRRLRERIIEKAAKVLELDTLVAERLFVPAGFGIEMYDITPPTSRPSNRSRDPLQRSEVG